MNILLLFGGNFYNAQEELLRPVVEDLAIDKFFLKEIYQHMQYTYTGLKTWFTDFFGYNKPGLFDWERVKIIAENERKQLFGIPLSQWFGNAIGTDKLNLAQISRDENLPLPVVRKSVRHLLSMDSSDTLPRGFRTINDYFVFMVKRAYTIKNVLDGAKLSDIYYRFFSLKGDNVDVETFFRKLFPGMSMAKIKESYRENLMVEWDTITMRLYKEIPPLIREFVFELSGFDTFLDLLSYGRHMFGQEFK
ncbi:hypothetical protein LCGC14_0658550 [marine sediment metagenome]|uniref:Uncharacterized protein n=1 Tax=marine sediment metagenome TaxID=412755 RepID=A0A0F9RE67_9ZZZZ|nr:hypothetical protein [archaeon]